MIERKINIGRPEDIVYELFHDNKEIKDEFMNHFSKKILEFSKLFTKAYRRSEGLSEYTKKTSIQISYVIGLTYLLFDNIFSSMKLLIQGFLTPSGNLMRQAIETMAVIILCSTKNDIYIDRKKTISFNYFNSFYNDEPKAYTHKAIKYLEINMDEIGVTGKGITAFKEIKDFYNKYSHPSRLSLTSITSFTDPGKIYIGGSFDDMKIPSYKIEIDEKINLCKTLPDFFEGVIDEVKQLTNP